MNNQAKFIGCYDFNDSVFLVEMIVNECSSKIEFERFCVPDNMIKQSDWQVAYMEQYLNLDGNDKLCEAYDTPTEQSKPSRITFFLYKSDNHKLSTPYGDFSTESLQKLPDRLAKIIDFDDCD